MAKPATKPAPAVERIARLTKLRNQRGTTDPSVMVDGVRVDSQSTGGATWEAIPLSQIERIEIVRGPASVVHGADAVTGVVQVFTRRGRGPARGAGVVPGRREPDPAGGVEPRHRSSGRDRQRADRQQGLGDSAVRAAARRSRVYLPF